MITQEVVWRKINHLLIKITWETLGNSKHKHRSVDWYFREFIVFCKRVVFMSCLSKRNNNFEGRITQTLRNLIMTTSSPTSTAKTLLKAISLKKVSFLNYYFKKLINGRAYWKNKIQLRLTFFIRRHQYLILNQSYKLNELLRKC